MQLTGTISIISQIATLVENVSDKWLSGAHNSVCIIDIPIGERTYSLFCHMESYRKFQNYSAQTKQCIQQAYLQNISDTKSILDKNYKSITVPRTAQTLGSKGYTALGQQH